MGTTTLTKQHTESAAHIVRSIRNGTRSAVAVAEAFIEQAERWESINAFISLRPEQLLADARAIDERLAAGEKVGPLAGLPIIVKDCIDTADYPTTSGTPALQGYRPKQNAPALQRLLDAGAIVAGKANMHELAYGTTSNNGYTGAVHNPYNASMISGGSSGGPAAAIAAGVGIVGLGTDTGGSIRIPAALCGVAGLRPTHSRWPSAGMMPAVHTRDVIGPLGHNVADLCLLDSVVTGEPLAKPAQLRGVRLGVPRDSCWTDLDPQVKAVAEQALQKLRKAGVELIEVDISEIVAIDQEHGFTIVFFETPIDMSAYLIAGNAGITYDELLNPIVSPQVIGDMPHALSVTADAYRTALEGRARMQSLYATCWEQYNIDALVFPTTVMPARPIGEDTTVELNGRQVPTFPTYIRNTSPASVGGIPGLTLPAGLTQSGLPVGLEIDGPAWHDRELLGLGLAIEKLFPALPAPVLAEEVLAGNV
jgi:Asp-tRNA(Asn)/Glu-tRNA(Gln) amidotransferase A subunit family amidase